MARGNMLLVLVGCVLLATVCMVQADRDETIRFEIYEHESQSNEVPVFGPPSRDSLNVFADKNNKGRGIVFSNRATKERSLESERVANVSGLYYYVSNNQVQKISTIKFKDVEINQDRRFANAQLHLRGVWNRGQGQQSRNQEVAIVGGSGGLARARGIARYEKVQGKDTYRVVGRIQIGSEPNSF